MIYYTIYNCIYYYIYLLKILLGEKLKRSGYKMRDNLKRNKMKRNEYE